MKKGVIILIVLFFIISIQVNALVPPKGKALIYIIRDSYYGKPFKYFTTCDNRKLGWTYGATYIYAFLTPGKHLLVTKSDITTKFTITVRAGGTYYVRVVPYPVIWKGGASLTLVDAAEGKKRLSKCKLSSGNGQ